MGKSYENIARWDALYHQYLQNKPVKDIAEDQEPEMTPSGIYKGFKKYDKPLRKKPRTNPNIKAN